MKVVHAQNRRLGPWLHGKPLTLREASSSSDSYAGTVAQQMVPQGAGESPAPATEPVPPTPLDLPAAEPALASKDSPRPTELQAHLSGVKLREAKATNDPKRLTALVKDSDILVRREAGKRIHALTAQQPFISQAYLRNGGDARGAALETLETIRRALDAHKDSLLGAIDILSRVEQPSTEELRGLAGLRYRTRGEFEAHPEVGKAAGDLLGRWFSRPEFTLIKEGRPVEFEPAQFFEDTKHVPAEVDGGRVAVRPPVFARRPPPGLSPAALRIWEDVSEPPVRSADSFKSADPEVAREVVAELMGANDQRLFNSLNQLWEQTTWGTHWNSPAPAGTGERFSPVLDILAQAHRRGVEPSQHADGLLGQIIEKCPELATPEAYAKNLPFAAANLHLALNFQQAGHTSAIDEALDYHLKNPGERLPSPNYSVLESAMKHEGWVPQAHHLPLFVADLYPDIHSSLRIQSQRVMLLIAREQPALLEGLRLPDPQGEYRPLRESLADWLLQTDKPINTGVVRELIATDSALGARLADELVQNGGDLSEKDIVKAGSIDVNQLDSGRKELLLNRLETRLLEPGHTQELDPYRKILQNRRLEEFKKDPRADLAIDVVLLSYANGTPSGELLNDFRKVSRRHFTPESRVRFGKDCLEVLRNNLDEKGVGPANERGWSAFHLLFQLAHDERGWTDELQALFQPALESKEWSTRWVSGYYHDSAPALVQGLIERRELADELAAPEGFELASAREQHSDEAVVRALFQGFKTTENAEEMGSAEEALLEPPFLGELLPELVAGDRAQVVENFYLTRFLMQKLPVNDRVRLPELIAKGQELRAGGADRGEIEQALLADVVVGGETADMVEIDFGEDYIQIGDVLLER